ncbi:MAG: CDP-2,3-bis-(O-geranylgeranyl)-sn-glycerol synthase [Thermoplasmatales archaeon]|nr:CDP-2,3-bis-(O-geranylgeranyl)-sn-glycerol synthase [Thermoplasmatales archaeon]
MLEIFKETGILILESLWLILPAYVANSFAVIVGGGKPVDFGKKFVDGKRLLGDGKTWKGLIGGIIFGMCIGLVQTYSADSIAFPNFGFFPIFFLVLFCLAFGALSGDLCKSFIKRRINIERGGKLPVIDQLDFVAGAFLFLLILSPSWFFQNFTVYHIIIILVATPLLHRIMNIAGYKVGKKKVPW